MRPAVDTLVRLTLRDMTVSSFVKSEFDPAEHTRGAIGWIMRARQATSDGGISKGYSLLKSRWGPSYPETSGYTIPTLLDYSQATGLPQYRQTALQIAEYLLRVQMTDGGVPDWRSLCDGRPTAVVFDTGQVILGWLRAYEETGDERYKRAALRAADWLVACQHTEGFWSEFQYLGTVKVIDTRVAWALLKAHRLTSYPQYAKAARHNLEWALTQQKTNGWFHNCSFRTGAHPITHTIAYTAEGLLRSGLLLDEGRYVESARRTANALLAKQRHDGALSSTFDSRWNAASRSSCLVGNCQIACVWLRLHELVGQNEYLDAADKALAFVAATQDLETLNQNVRGGIGGSHPIYGRYEMYQYPNWAAKFFVDAMLLWTKIGGRQ